MADFDVNSLLQNPLLLAGVNILGDKGNNVAQNMSAGFSAAQQQQLAPITLALKKMELERAKNAQSFNPADYLQLDQSEPNGLLTGSTSSLTQQATQPGAAPAALAGPIGQLPQQAQQMPSQGQVQFQPGSQPVQGTGQTLNLPAMIGAGMKAGYPIQDIQAAAMAMDPVGYAKLQAMTKSMTPYNLGPGEQHYDPVSGQTTTNSMAPPSSKAGQIAQLTNLRDQFPKDSEQYKQYDSALREVTGQAQQGRFDTTQQRLNYALFGDPEAVESTAQAVAGYRQAPPSSYSMKSPQAQAIMKRVREINPDYDQTKYNTAQKTYNSFTTGTQGNIVRSMNVGIEHLQTLNGLVDALDNNDLQAVNRIGNIFKAQTGQTAPTNFNAAKTIVADEITKAIVGSQNALGDREQLQKSLDAANSPQQLKQVISTWTKLMGGQLKGLEQQYKSGAMRDDFGNFLTPNAKLAIEGGQMKVPVRSGMQNGRRVIQYNDGSIEFAQ